MNLLFTAPSRSNKGITVKWANSPTYSKLSKSRRYTFPYPVLYGLYLIVWNTTGTKLTVLLPPNFIWSPEIGSSSQAHRFPNSNIISSPYGIHVQVSLRGACHHPIRLVSCLSRAHVSDFVVWLHFFCKIDDESRSILCTFSSPFIPSISWLRNPSLAGDTTFGSFGWCSPDYCLQNRVGYEYGTQVNRALTGGMMLWAVGMYVH